MFIGIENKGNKKMNIWQGARDAKRELEIKRRREKMNGQIIHVTKDEWNKIANQMNVEYEIVKDGDNPQNWYYRVYYYDVLDNLISIMIYKYVM